MDASLLVLLTIVVVAVSITLLIGLAAFALTCVTYDRTRSLPESAQRLSAIEEQLKIITDQLELDLMGGVGEFRSMDGKYTANTLEDLVQQMAQGGDIDIDPNDPDLLKKFFEQLTDDESDDDDKKPWEK